MWIDVDYTVIEEGDIGHVKVKVKALLYDTDKKYKWFVEGGTIVVDIGSSGSFNEIRYMQTMVKREYIN